MSTTGDQAPIPEKDALTGEQRASLLRVLDWGVESRNMTHETALQVLGIVDKAYSLPSGSDQEET